MSLNEFRSKYRAVNHDSSPEISTIFRGNNSRISRKFVCILFAQYCTCMTEVESQIYREKWRIVFVTGNLFTLTCGFMFNLFSYYKLVILVCEVHP